MAGCTFLPFYLFLKSDLRFSSAGTNPPLIGFFPTVFAVERSAATQRGNLITPMESSQHQRLNYNFGMCSSSGGGGGDGSALHVGVCKHTARGFEA